MKVALPRKLWQRNAVALLVVIAALAVWVTTSVGPAWSSYRALIIPAHVVPAGQSLSFDGHNWRLSGVKHFNQTAVPGARTLPDGTVLLVVSIDHSGGKLEPVCTGVVTDGQRRWRDEGIGGYAGIPPDGVSNSCGTSGPLQFTFLLPRDAVPTAVDVVAYGGAITVRLEL